MEAQRTGSRYTKTCPICSRRFWTDSKRVVYCSRACSLKADKTRWENLKRYREHPEVKEKLAKYARDYRKRQKEKKLAAGIRIYFTRMH